MLSAVARRFSLLLLIMLSAQLFAQCASLAKREPVPVVGRTGMIVASHPVATQIGLQILNSGGNAVDAAVATGLALGVVDQFNSGIGGGGFIVIRMADGAVHAIDGRETAPVAATKDMYILDGKLQPDITKIGPRAVGVPGMLAAYEKALELAGTQSLAYLIEPSIAVAENGFKLDEYYIERYSEATAQLRQDPACAAIYFRPDGSPLRAGDILKQPDLANTYRSIGDGGTDYFYRGEFAEVLAEYMLEHGGLITRGDMANYTALVRDPIIGTYRGCQIIGMPPPSSGGVHVLQLLNMTEASGILQKKTGWDTESIYWISRFMSKAFEDRAAFLGDPDFFPVPVERLTGKEYAEESVRAITGNNGALLAHSGAPLRSADPLAAAGFSSHTTNLCVIDRWGNAVAINQTVNLMYGAKITLPGTGVILNNQMDDFSVQPGVPNAFGLIGSEANSIAPGKRPLSSMAPTIVVRDGRPILILGGAGGPVIITAVFETIVNVIDFGMEMAEAQRQPRFHHQFKPNVLIVEDDLSLWTRLRLSAMTRRPVVRASRAIDDTLGRVHAIAWNEDTCAYVGVADPRGGGSAAAGKWLTLTPIDLPVAGPPLRLKGGRASPLIPYRTPMPLR